MSDTRSARYLRDEIDPESGDPTGSRLELERDGLTTHGRIVGMTGSGKTGLGVCLLEEVDDFGVPLERSDVSLDELVLFWALRY